MLVWSAISLPSDERRITRGDPGELQFVSVLSNDDELTVRQLGHVLAGIVRRPVDCSCPLVCPDAAELEEDDIPCWRTAEAHASRQ